MALRISSRNSRSVGHAVACGRPARASRAESDPLLRSSAEEMAEALIAVLCTDEMRPKRWCHAGWPSALMPSRGARRWLYDEGPGPPARDYDVPASPRRDPGGPGVQGGERGRTRSGSRVNCSSASRYSLSRHARLQPGLRGALRERFRHLRHGICAIRSARSRACSRCSTMNPPVRSACQPELSRDGKRNRGRRSRTSSPTG